MLIVLKSSTQLYCTAVHRETLEFHFLYYLSLSCTHLPSSSATPKFLKIQGISFLVLFIITQYSSFAFWCAKVQGRPPNDFCSTRPAQCQITEKLSHFISRTICFAEIQTPCFQQYKFETWPYYFQLHMLPRMERYVMATLYFHR